MILSFCGGTAFSSMTEQDIWSHNKQAIIDYLPNGKDLKLIWEFDPKIGRVIRMFETLMDLGTAGSISFPFRGRVKAYCVINIPNKNIRQFQERVRALA